MVLWPLAKIANALCENALCGLVFRDWAETEAALLVWILARGGAAC
nr:MAG TPA: hypothetical protein [Caudoviricetes sp.]